MRRAERLLICVVLSLMVVGSAMPAWATTFDSNNVVPAPWYNSIPWGDNYSTRYQLWFSQSMMNGYTGYIDGITQFVSQNGGEVSYNVDIYASTTTVGSGALNANDPDANRGVNNVRIFSGNIALTATSSTLMIDTNQAFNYDGSGNLLLDFIFHSITGDSSFYGFEAAQGSSEFFRVINSGYYGNMVDSGGALRTQIDFTTAPIPSTSLLIGSGLLGLAGCRWFRKS